MKLWNLNEETHTLLRCSCKTDACRCFKIFAHVVCGKTRNTWSGVPPFWGGGQVKPVATESYITDPSRTNLDPRPSWQQILANGYLCQYKSMGQGSITSILALHRLPIVKPQTSSRSIPNDWHKAWIIATIPLQTFSVSKFCQITKIVAHVTKIFHHWARTSERS